MDSFIARANIDHFLGLLRVEVVAESRAVLNSLLVDELSKLDGKHLEYVEDAVAKYRLNFEGLVRQRDGFPDGSPEQRSADHVLVGLEITLKIIDGICGRMRERVANGPLRAP